MNDNNDLNNVRTVNDASTSNPDDVVNDSNVWNDTRPGDAASTPNEVRTLNFVDAARDIHALRDEPVKTPPDTVQGIEARQEDPKDMQEATTPIKTAQGEPLRWFKNEETAELLSRWNSIQIKFVDDPHTSVEQANALVADAVERIVKVFTDKKTLLEKEWIEKTDISTEDLRTSLQSYRSFLNRLLAL